MNTQKLLRSGFSLMEMVIVVIIIGILMAAITKMTSATKSAKVSTLVQGFQNLATAAVQYQQQNSGSYSGIKLNGNGSLVDLGILGKDWLNNGNAKNPFAGGFKITSIASGNGFKITANNIPQDICKKFGDGSNPDKAKYKIPGADNFGCVNRNTVVAVYGSSNLK